MEVLDKMESIKLKHNSINDLSMSQLKSFLRGKQYREFIQFFLLDNKKGENGLIVKKLLDNT
jgi:hypothetical protein